MFYDAQLQFVRDLLFGMHIPTHIVENPSEYISCDIDLGLRASLFGINNYANFLDNSMYDARPNTIYRFFDEYYCNYLFFQLPDTHPEQFFFVGPYLLETPPQEKIRKKATSIGLSNVQFDSFYKFYTNLPVVEDENLLFTIINTLAKTIWTIPDQYSVEYIDYMIPDHSSPVQIPPIIHDNSHSSFNLAILEENAFNEKLLMEAVSQGQLHKVNAVASTVFNKGTEQRLPDSLRNRKNYLIILNTLLRKAAEYGGVDVVHINRISSSFAQQIENIFSMNESMHLQEKMIRSYCLLVKNHSLSKYSNLIGKSITLIYYDLTADLSLNSIAQTLNVNPSYLSSLFRKECGCTLTDYVNNRRIEHAVTLLNTTDKQIQNIAFECGIQDTNYFIKLFKKYTGLTPTGYKEQIGKRK